MQRCSPAVPDETAAPSADTTDPNGTWPNRAGEPSAVSAVSSPAAEDEAEYADATGPNDVDVVRVPEAGDRDYWDDAANRTTAPGGAVAADETTVPVEEVDADETTVPAVGVTAPAAVAAAIPDTEIAAESVPTGKHAAAAAASADAGLRPGEATDRLGDFGDIAFGNLLPDAAQFTAQWQQIQYRFVDDPQGSVTEAADVVSQVTTRLEAAIRERQRAIEERQRAIEERAGALRGRWGEGSNADTETLRETLRMYRAFMDQLIGPAA